MTNALAHNQQAATQDSAQQVPARMPGITTGFCFFSLFVFSLHYFSCTLVRFT